MIETRLMQYFLAVAKVTEYHKSSKSAAHHTALLLSRQMAMLEKEIGATLFYKGKQTTFSYQ